MFASKLEQNNLKATIAASYNKLYSQFSSDELSEVGNYKILKMIGEGSFGKVYLARHRPTHQKVVLKTGSKRDPNVVREVFYHRQFDYNHITKLYEVIVTENNVWMALEYCSGRELYEYLLMRKQLPADECSRLFSQIVGAVFYAHALKCVHRDLKLENILLDKRGQAKLTDFGFTRECATKSMLETICGTTVYMAPELIEKKTYDGFKIDTWSLGVILYTLLFGCMPFDEEDETRTKLKIVNEDPGYENGVTTAAAKDLISKLLQKDPLLRPSLEEVLNHQFLQPYGLYVLGKTEKILKQQKRGGRNFRGKIERRLLKKLKQSGFDTQGIKQSVNKRKCDCLSGLWYLSLEKEKRSEFTKLPRRSRSVLSVKRVFDVGPPLKSAAESIKDFNSSAGQQTSLLRVVSRRSEDNAGRKPHSPHSEGQTSPLRALQSNGSSSPSSGRHKKNNIFMKMTSFFKNKKQHSAHGTGSNSANSSIIKKTEKREFNPSMDLKEPNGTGALHKSKLSFGSEKSESVPSEAFKVHPDATESRHVLEKLKSNTSSEVSRQTSGGNYDSEFDYRNGKHGIPDDGDNQKYDPPPRGRPLSIVSHQSEFSNDTYNSEYSTDGNPPSSSKGNSTISSGTNRNINAVIMSAKSDSSEINSSFNKAVARRSVSIMSSASSASEKSSRADSFQEISTAPSPKGMDIRAMNGFTSGTDTVAPRIKLGSHWLSKRGPSSLRRGRLPKRTLNRKFMSRHSSGRQSVIQEESSLTDEDETQDLLIGQGPYVSSEEHEGSPKFESQTPSKAGTPFSSVPTREDIRPEVASVRQSFSEGSGWSHDLSEDNVDSTNFDSGTHAEEYSVSEIADHEDNKEGE
ncbi:LAMI_0F04544g1_1 [Lachancea mirantina]|uniref:non-specific serine/threonine protein kinase n=1 Tax=Lachancea mirantina TaxID=1230905 RepID=A0A1G4JXX2_9SACH|nr:LAMI_0F04544g1_1 [Lachancea mirantina]